METVIIAAVGSNGVIGVENRLPWRIPEDLARFKSMTMGQSLVMGRSTYESIGRPLPGRSTIVLTRDPGWQSEGVSVSGSLEAALEMVESRGHDAYICGGATVYEEALGVADVLELTEVDQDPEGDTFFPDVDWSAWQEAARIERPGYAFVTYRRA